MAAVANRSGAQLRPQMTTRSVGVLFSLGANTLLDVAQFAAELPAQAPSRQQRLSFIGSGPSGRGDLARRHRDIRAALAANRTATATTRR